MTHLGSKNSTDGANRCVETPPQNRSWRDLTVDCSHDLPTVVTTVGAPPPSESREPSARGCCEEESREEVRRRRHHRSRRSGGRPQTSGHVYRLHRRARSAPPCVGGRRQRG